MKKILLMGAIGLSVFSIAQQKLESPKDYYLNSKMKADSLNVDYSDTNEFIDKIEIITDFKDRLLINNNYKDTEQRKYIIEEFKSYLPPKIDYFKLCTTEEKIINFYELETTKLYSKSYTSINRKIKNYYKIQISILEQEIINKFRKANYPLEKYNRLSDDEKKVIIEKIDSGFVFP